jgi:hypothetical protein
MDLKDSAKPVNCFPCNECELETQHIDELVEHKKTVHEVLKYACDLCEHVDGLLEGLWRHKIDAHQAYVPDTPEATYHENLADTWQASLETLLGEPTVKRNPAGTEYDRMWKVNHLNSEITIHIHNKPKNNSNCPKCKFSGNKSELVKHLKQKHGRKHVCEECETNYMDVKTLKLHIQTKHENPSPIEPFPCDLCGLVLANFNLLQQHVKEHTPVKFSCQYCDSTEGNQESLQCHMIKAHNEIAILCNMAKPMDKLTDNFASFENFKSELSSVLKSLFDNQHILKQEMFLIRNNQPKPQARYPTTETEVKQRKRATEDDDISPSMPAPPAGPPVPPPRTMSSSSTNVSRAPPPARNTEPTAEQSSPSCPPQSSPPSPSACALEVVTQCDECSFQDIRKENILNHRIAKHSCDKCDFVTRQKSELNRHKLSVHGKQSISQYQCDLCSFADVNEENVLNHKIAKP